MMPHGDSLPRQQRVRLGGGEVHASRLCLGLGSSGCGSTSMQGRLPPDEVAAFLVAASAHGVTWFDTSDDYGSQPHVRAACQRLGRDQVQITTKSHARDGATLRDSLISSLRELGTDHVDVFLLHEVDSPEDLAAREDAALALRDLQAEGLARLVGLSTHNIDVLERAAGDARFDVLMTNYNVAGIHMDASHEDYARALRRAFEAGQATVVMKTLGEGALAARHAEALRHNLALDFVHGVVVGVKSLDEALRAVQVWQEFCASP
ncbi:MAG: aldo/keto reductase [Proteobacteria bacterium]|nr:aldo/keto reductase [Pseudomonadota bacterium]